jgi:hypothetical protein
MSGGGQTTRFIMRDNKSHIIDDTGKTIMVMPVTDAMEQGGVKTAGLRFVSSGTARFDGRNLPYDEYTAQDGERIQYFIDGNRLAGFRNFDDGSAVADMVISEFNQNVPNNVFDLPRGYQTIEMPRF